MPQEDGFSSVGLRMGVIKLAMAGTRHQSPPLGYWRYTDILTKIMRIFQQQKRNKMIHVKPGLLENAIVSP